MGKRLFILLAEQRKNMRPSLFLRDFAALLRSLETKSPDQGNLDVHDTKNQEQDHILEQDQDSSQ